MNELAGGIDRPSIQPMRGTEGSPIIGPTNPAREAQNLDRLAPPKTDHGTLPNLNGRLPTAIRWRVRDL